MGAQPGMIGQLHYLASLGLPIPARHAQLTLPDQIFTHFEREESLATMRGKFEDELVRIHEILQHATERSLLVMNESFSSTTLADAPRSSHRGLADVSATCTRECALSEVVRERSTTQSGPRELPCAARLAAVSAMCTTEITLVLSVAAREPFTGSEPPPSPTTALRSSRDPDPAQIRPELAARLRPQPQP